MMKQGHPVHLKRAFALENIVIPATVTINQPAPLCILPVRLMEFGAVLRGLALFTELTVAFSVGLIWKS